MREPTVDVVRVCQLWHMWCGTNLKSSDCKNTEYWIVPDDARIMFATNEGTFSVIIGLVLAGIFSPQGQKEW